ncbi:MAG: HAD-IIB family hydrolase [Alphaproteobacteria bacterium]
MRIITEDSIKGMKQIITRNTIILSDLDGTVLPLLHDPAQRFIDPKAHDAFVRFNAFAPGQVIPITGRDWEQVLKCFHGKTPTFPVISSNGAQLHIPGQKEITHAFTLREINFLREMRQTMTEFKARHPELVTEVKRFEIGFHSEPATGYGHCSRDFILSLANRCEAVMAKLEEKAQSEKLKFRIASTEVTAQEMSHGDIDKLQAILFFFTTHLPAILGSNDWKNVVYCGDSLMKGNDRTIAIAVKERGGKVCQVINGVPDRIPPKDDPAYPHFVFNDPAALGALLQRQVANAESAPTKRAPRRASPAPGG